MITVTIDCNANQSVLRRLEREGHIQVHAVDIEAHKTSKKLKRKELPIAVFDSPFATFGGSVIARNDTPYSALLSLLGGNAQVGEVTHIEAHIRSGRDIFVSDDRDVLRYRETLFDEFGVTVCSVKELEAKFTSNT